MVKAAWATNPSRIQALNWSMKTACNHAVNCCSRSAMSDFLCLGHAPPPPLQPPHADQVRRPLEAPVEDAVVGFSVPSRPVNNVAVDNAVALLDHQRRHEPVGAIKKRQHAQYAGMN